MKVILFIDSLASGGAQRQICVLAKLLKKRGLEVCLLTYYPNDFFGEFLAEEPSVSVYKIEWKGQINRLFKVRKFLRDHSPDVVISFLETPNVIAELSKLLLLPRFRLIVSERDHDYQTPSIKRWLLLVMLLFADAVVANSHVQANFLHQNAPWIRKAWVVTNCLDLQLFRPGELVVDGNRTNELRLVVLGRYEPQKNGIAVIEALSDYLKNRGGLPSIRFDWYGNDPHPECRQIEEMCIRIRNLKLESNFFLHEAESDVISIYNAADALCLASFHEGCANVVCEAMACGVPVIATHAGDNGLLVNDGVNGILINGFDPKAISQGLRRFSMLSPSDRMNMCRESRLRAEKMLSPERFLDEWLTVIQN